MNFVFLSPNFPPNYYLFCARLRAFSVNVLGLSDQPYEYLAPELRAALTEYYRVSDLHSYDETLRALGYFTHRYGKIDRLDSMNEYWLSTDARLRTDFNIDGFKLAELPRIKQKSVMKRLFIEAGIPVARGQVASTPEAVWAFVNDVGYPVVAKPDIGVGANQTYKIASAQELDRFLAELLADYFIEEYVQGVIQTFDGLADRQGNPVFFTSMQYSDGVMEVVNNDGDVYYYTQRVIPPDIEQAGRTILAAFDVRECFFHFEFFRTTDGRLLALEVNMRPPGGLSLDMFNYAHDLDIYHEWANMVVHGCFEARYARPFHACYVGRKYHKPYLHTHSDILSRYGDRIAHHQPMSGVFRRAMGDHGYIIRSPDLDEAIAIANFIQA